MWGMSLNAFPDVSAIKSSHYFLTGTSTSQVVDRIVFDKIISILDSILFLSQSKNDSDL